MMWSQGEWSIPRPPRTVVSAKKRRGRLSKHTGLIGRWKFQFYLSTGPLTSVDPLGIYGTNVVSDTISWLVASNMCSFHTGFYRGILQPTSNLPALIQRGEETRHKSRLNRPALGLTKLADDFGLLQLNN